MVKGIHQCHAAAGNGRCAGTAIGLYDVAIDGDGVFPEGGQIDCGTQGAADQALDFNGAAALFAAGGFPTHAAAGGARQHAVFGGDPALAFAPQERGYLVFDGGGADNLGVAEFHQHRTFGVAGVIAGNSDISGLFGRSAAWTHSVS